MPAALSWGIKSSFLRYLESLPDCTIATNDGAYRESSSGEFVFPFTDRTELEGEDHRLEFKGDVRLSAHGGLLLVIFMNPWLTFIDDRVELSVVDLMHWPDVSRREVIGESEAPRGREFPLTLAESALETFNNVYPAGVPLDPVRLL